MKARKARRLALLAFAVALCALASPRVAVAQHDSAQTRASIGASIVPGLSVRKTQDLIVGAFRPGQDLGTVEINVGTSGGSMGTSQTASGGVVLATGSYSAAQFSVTGPAGGPVHFTVALPSSITIQRVGGGETMAVDGFRSNVSAECAPGSSTGGCPASPYTLLVGATLHVEPNQRAGQYVGAFTVTVNQL